MTTATSNKQGNAKAKQQCIHADGGGASTTHLFTVGVVSSEGWVGFRHPNRRLVN